MNGTCRSRLVVAVSTALLTVLAACGGGGDAGDAATKATNATSPVTDPLSAGTQRATVESYLKGLPGWGAFAQNPPDTVDDVKGATVSNVPERVGTQDYICTKTKYSLSRTPEKIVMFSPDREVMWPGALIQGRSHKELGSLASLPIRQRAPLKVSIPSLPNGGNFRVIDNPDQASVSGAIGEMVGNATIADLDAPSSIAFTMSDYTNERTFGLKAGISGKYLKFEASASASVDTAANEHTVMVYFIEKMFEVVVEPPESPVAMFSDAFTMAKLQEHIDLGRIGKDNVPVYVSNVVYGRIMGFTLTSTKSSAEIKAALSAAYKGTIFNASGQIDTSYKTLMEGARIAITSLGGPSKATAAMIASLQWQDYFKENADLSTAYPISYTLRNLGDGSIASVSEPGSYEVKECSPSVNGGFMLDSFEPVAVAGKGQVDLWVPADADSEAVLDATGGEATSPFAIFYGFQKVTQKMGWELDFQGTRAVWKYRIGYVKAPHFTDDMSLWYGSRMSYWTRPDDRLRRTHALADPVVPTNSDYCYEYSPGTLRHCIYADFAAFFEKETPIAFGGWGGDADKWANWKIWAYEEPTPGYPEIASTTADTLVLRGGGTREFEMLTLTYRQPVRAVPIEWTQHEVTLSSNAGQVACKTPPYHGCWLLEGKPATEADFRYVLKAVKELRLRASYLVTRQMPNNYWDEPGSSPPVRHHWDVPQGYVGAYFDEIKFVRPTP